MVNGLVMEPEKPDDVSSRIHYRYIARDARVFIDRFVAVAALLALAVVGLFAGAVYYLLR